MILLPDGVASTRIVPTTLLPQELWGPPLIRPPDPDAATAKASAPAWSPVTLRPDGARRKVDALEVSAIVLDYDKDVVDLDALLDVWAPAECYIHTSYRHTAEHPKCRVIVPLARPVPAEDWPRVWLWAASKGPIRPDPACKSAVHAYILPVVQYEGAPFYSAFRLGPKLDLEGVDFPAAEIAPDVGRFTAHTDVPPAIKAKAIEHVRAALAWRCGILAGMTEGRREFTQRLAYMVAGYAWADETILPLAATSIAKALVASGRWDEGMSKMLRTTLDEGALDPLALDDLITPAEEDVIAEELPRLVVSGSTAYVLSTAGQYQRTRSPQEAIIRLRDRGDVVLHRTTAKGTAGAELSWTAVCRMYGAAADAVVLTYPRPDGEIPGAWRDGVLTVSTAHAPAVSPRYDPEVSAWLAAGLSAADDITKDRVMDWLATAWTCLDRPSCALYVHGPGGTGKSMLASALASPWRTSPVPMGLAMQRFNAALARCPLIHLDEDQTTAGGAPVDSGAFRDTISARVQRIEHKGGDVVELRSAIRGIVTANNYLALAPPPVATLDDIGAIVERILYVPWSGRAKAYLSSIRRTAPTEGWVTAEDGGPGKIARHIAALDRRVAGGARWVVEGIIGPYHAGFLTRVPSIADHLDVIVAAMARGGQGCTGVKWTADGDVAVTLGTLRADWARLGCRTDYRQGVMAEVLQSLSRRPGVGGVWEVDGDTVRGYAARFGISLR